MILFLGQYLKNNIKLYQNLRQYFGINHFTAKKIMSNLGLHLNSRKVKKTQKDFWIIGNKLLQKYIFGKNLKDEKSKIISKLKANGSYSGIRFSQGLPTNGQRTRTNRKTARKLNRLWDRYDTNKIHTKKNQNPTNQNKVINGRKIQKQIKK